MEITILFILVAICLVAILGITVFIWIQFNFTDSKLSRLIDNRSRLNDIPELEDSEVEESNKEDNPNEYL